MMAALGSQTSGSALWKRCAKGGSYGYISPDRKFVLSNDLGNDKVYSYNTIKLG
jgi:6-phosphogluconolactonase (cycloisomerase 2 family)